MHSITLIAAIFHPVTLNVNNALKKYSRDPRNQLFLLKNSYIEFFDGWP